MHLRSSSPLRSLALQIESQNYGKGGEDAGQEREAKKGTSGSGWLQLVAFKGGAMASAIFLFFSTSSLVSFTLRETQVRLESVGVVYM